MKFYVRSCSPGAHDAVSVAKQRASSSNMHRRVWALHAALLFGVTEMVNRAILQNFHDKILFLFAELLSTFYYSLQSRETDIFSESDRCDICVVDASRSNLRHSLVQTYHRA